VVTTTIRFQYDFLIGLRFDCRLTALRPFYVTAYLFALLHCGLFVLNVRLNTSKPNQTCGLNKQAVRVATQYAPAPLLPSWAP